MRAGRPGAGGGPAATQWRPRGGGAVHVGLLSCRPARSGPAHRGPPEPALCIGVSCSFLFEHCSAFPCFGGADSHDTSPAWSPAFPRGCDPPARRSWACVWSESALRLTWAGLRPRLMRSGPDEAPLQSSHRQLRPLTFLLPRPSRHPALRLPRSDPAGCPWQGAREATESGVQAFAVPLPTRG